MDRHTKITRTLWVILALPVVLLPLLLVAESIGGAGHPPLSAVLLYFAAYPTLTGYLSRSLLGPEFLSVPLLFLGLLEYPLIAVGVVSLIPTSRRQVAAGGRIAIAVLLLLYVGAHGIAHLLLNLQSVNLRLMAHANPRVSLAAVDRLRDNQHADALPALQRKLVADFERDGTLESGLLDTLTALGGARGWHELLESGRFGVAGRRAYAWQFIAANVRDMANPWFADVRGGVPTRGFSDQEIARFFEALALALATRLQTAPDDEASQTLLVVLKERPDLCREYSDLVPDRLRNRGPC